MELWRLLICAKYFSEESVRERGAMGCSVRLFVIFGFYQIFILTDASFFFTMHFFPYGMITLIRFLSVVSSIFLSLVWPGLCSDVR